MTNNGETVDPKERSSKNVDTDFWSAIFTSLLLYNYSVVITYAMHTLINSNINT